MNANTTTRATDAPGQGFLSGLGRMIRRLGETIADASQAMQCAREAERLFAMSDAELARRGLTRDQIVRHAFRNHLGL